MTLNRFAFAMICMAAMGCDRDVAIHVPEPGGCWAIATGARSFWRPRAWLSKPDTKQTAKFWLAAANERPRLVDDWVQMFEGIPNKSQPGYSNWQYTSRNVLQLRFFDVDWRYAMDLSTVSTDSVRGYVRFSGDTKAGTSRILGSRIACPSPVDSAGAILLPNTKR